MTKGVLNEVVQRVQRTLLQEEVGLTDGQLLQCFIEHGDERAFSTIVRRHGPLVLGVCRRILPHHDAQDAFQATFLVLARKAAAISAPELLANWLHGVAYNAARKARALLARRRVRERQMMAIPEPEVPEPARWNDLKPLLDQEIRQLPEKYRLPILLCDLEGKSRKEVARQLGWAEGTLSGRLARARTMLARRLARRGVGVSGGLLAALVSENAVSARVPAELLSSTIQAAGLFASGQGTAEGVLSATVVALTKGVLKSMLWTKTKIGVVVLLGLGLIAFGGGLVTCQLAPAQQAEVASGGVTPKACPPAPAETASRRYQVEFTVIQTLIMPDTAQPTLSKEKILAHPTLFVTEGVEGSFCAGGEIAVPTDKRSPVDILNYGTSVRVKIVGLGDGRLRLQTALELSDVDRTAEKGTQVSGKIVRSIATVRLGEPIRLTVNDNAGRVQHCLTVKVVNEETVITKMRSPAADSREKPGNRKIGVGPNSDAGRTGGIALNERNFDISPASRHSEVARLREQVKSLEERLAALEEQSLKTDVKETIPAARVGQIIVVGNTKTPTNVIVKHLALFPGQVLEYPALRQAEKNLAKWKATVAILESGDNSAYKDILVTVKEQ